MPLTDGRVPDEAQILPDTGVECRFTGSKASTDTKLHHQWASANVQGVPPVYCTLHERHPQFPDPYIHPVAPQYPELRTRRIPGTSNRICIKEIVIVSIIDQGVFRDCENNTQVIYSTHHMSEGTTMPRNLDDAISGGQPVILLFRG